MNGQRHGQGRYTYADGGTYEGEWRNNVSAATHLLKLELLYISSPYPNVEHMATENLRMPMAKSILVISKTVRSMVKVCVPFR